MITQICKADKRRGLCQNCKHGHTSKFTTIVDILRPRSHNPGTPVDIQSLPPVCFQTNVPPMFRLLTRLASPNGARLCSDVLQIIYNFYTFGPVPFDDGAGNVDQLYYSKDRNFIRGYELGCSSS